MSKSIKKISKSIFKRVLDSFRGIISLYFEESSLYPITFIIVLIYTVAFILFKKMTSTDWAVIVVSTSLMLTVEIINTVFENIIDLINFKFNLKAKKIKNISASASLVMILGTIIAMLIIFISKLSS